MPKIVDKNEFLDAAKAVLGKDNLDEVTRKEITLIVKTKKIDWPNWLTNDPARRSGYGIYKVGDLMNNNIVEEEEISMEEEDDSLAIAAMAGPSTAQVLPLHPGMTGAPNFVPEKADGYVPFGHFSDVRSIVKSKKFYPIYITGLSGNGKTMMVEQVHAAERRELIRCNITIETDEDDLIGGFRLHDGKTVWQDGPVTVAMQRGATLLLDEVDLGSNKLMCLQPVLEGKGIFLKKVGRVVQPAHGFNVIATANTKGKGSDDGRFIGTNVMNEAFLERFSITLEQEYPPARSEAKILNNLLSKAGFDDTDFVDRLVAWADGTRKGFREGVNSEIISTRRLVHICEAFTIFNRDREKAVQLCLNRFDEDTKNSFMQYYKKLDEKVAPEDPKKNTTLDDTVPF
jgi:hypothetical protein